MAQSYIGTSVRRREDVRFLTGNATFIDDVKLPHMLHAAILRSPHAHARILSIDVAKAESLPGMVKVFTSRDLAGMNEPVPMRMYKLPGLEHYLQHILARDTVRYVGDPIAVAVAENRYLAEDALDAIEVSYEIKPEVVELREALRGRIEEQKKLLAVGQPVGARPRPHIEQACPAGPRRASHLFHMFF